MATLGEIKGKVESEGFDYYLTDYLNDEDVLTLNAAEPGLGDVMRALSDELRAVEARFDALMGGVDEYEEA